MKTEEKAQEMQENVVKDIPSENGSKELSKTASLVPENEFLEDGEIYNDESNDDEIYLEEEAQ